MPAGVGLKVSAGQQLHLNLHLYNASDNTLLGQSRGFGDGEMLTCPGNSPTCPNVSPGDFIVEVFPAVGGAVNTYTLALP